MEIVRIAPRGALRKVLVLTLLAATTFATLPARSATTRNAMPRWFSCGGVAPEVTSCEVKIKLHKDFRVGNVYGSGTGIYPGEAFVGQVDAVWESPSFEWKASKLSPRRPSAVPELLEWYIWDKKGAGDAPLGTQETVTMTGRATGAGPWAVKARILYLGPQPLPPYKWYSCRGHAPEQTTCTLRFKAGLNLMQGMGIGCCGRFQAEWATSTTRWWHDCTHAVNGTLNCKGGRVGGHDPKPWQMITMTATMTGVGNWHVYSRVTVRPCGRCDSVPGYD